MSVKKWFIAFPVCPRSGVYGVEEGGGGKEKNEKGGEGEEEDRWEVQGNLKICTPFPFLSVRKGIC